MRVGWIAKLWRRIVKKKMSKFFFDCEITCSTKAWSILEKFCQKNWNKTKQNETKQNKTKGVDKYYSKKINCNVYFCNKSFYLFLIIFTTKNVFSVFQINFILIVITIFFKLLLFLIVIKMFLKLISFLIVIKIVILRK